MGDPVILDLSLGPDSAPIPPAERHERQARLDAMGPWFYDVDLPGGVRIRSKVNETHAGIHATRRAMVEAALRARFDGDFARLRAIDLGCHEGYFGLVLRHLGIPEVLGIDVRRENLTRARMLAELSGWRGLCFREANCERLDEVLDERFDVALMLGLLYHQENPIGCLRQAARVCRGTLLVETQVVEDIDAPVEWGRRECVHPYEGHFALVDESVYEDNLETGASPLVLCPSPRALSTVLRHLGFDRIETLPAPAGANEQLARGRRVIVAADRER